MRAARRALGSPSSSPGERERRALLADAGRAVEEVGVRRVVAQRRLEQPLGLVLLADSVEHGEILECYPHPLSQFLLLERAVRAGRSARDRAGPAASKRSRARRETPRPRARCGRGLAPRALRGCGGVEHEDERPVREQPADDGEKTPSASPSISPAWRSPAPSSSCRPSPPCRPGRRRTAAPASSAPPMSVGAVHHRWPRPRRRHPGSSASRSRRS